MDSDVRSGPTGGAAGARLPLVLLAGLLSDATVWQEVSDRLASVTEVGVVTFENHTSIGAMAATVLAKAPSRCVLVGHSMGGRVALEVYRRAPERIVGLGLFATGVHPCREDEIEARCRLVRIAREEGMDALARAWLPPMMGVDESRVAELLPRLAAMVLRQTSASFAGQINALLNRPDATAVLASVQVPTLIATGSHDRWSPRPQHQAMAAQVAGARLVSIAGAGHMAPLEASAAVAEELRNLLECVAVAVRTGSDAVRSVP
jgi:pimeloyl-ACP methyl ester carboxylesterase